MDNPQKWHVLHPISKIISDRTKSLLAQISVDKITTMGYDIKNAAIYHKSNKVDPEISMRLQIIVHTNYSEKNTSSWKQYSLSWLW